MNKDLIIHLCGIHAFGFAVFHIFFWKLFKWKTDLVTISKPNRAILQIANIQIIFLLLFVGIVCFYFTEDLYQTHLGRAFLIGISIFWLVRAIQQFIFLRINHWMVHALTALFVIGIALAILPLLV